MHIAYSPAPGVLDLANYSQGGQEKQFSKMDGQGTALFYKSSYWPLRRLKPLEPLFPLEPLKGDQHSRNK